MLSRLIHHNHLINPRIYVLHEPLICAELTSSVRPSVMINATSITTARAANFFCTQFMLDPLLLIPAILRLVKRVLEQINNLGVCFCFHLLTASQRITDELRETERVDQLNKHNDCQSSVPTAPI